MLNRMGRCILNLSDIDVSCIYNNCTTLILLMFSIFFIFLYFFKKILGTLVLLYNYCIQITSLNLLIATWVLEVIYACGISLNNPQLFYVNLEVTSAA
jgi:hypothetical protein